MNGMPGGTNIEDFLSPKSMPTPALAGAIVAVITAALFRGFGLSVAICSIILSFSVGLIVFQSREFKSNSVSKLAKAIYYAINSLIIFAMATGTTSVFAEEVMIQERPFFYDWTKESKEPEINLPLLNQEYDLSVQVTQNEGPGIKGFLQKYGLVQKYYSTNITLVSMGNAQLGDVEKVELILPKDYFEVSSVVLSGKELDEGLNIKAWTGFRIEAIVTTMDGSTLRVDKFVNPSAGDSDD